MIHTAACLRSRSSRLRRLITFARRYFRVSITFPKVEQLRTLSVRVLLPGVYFEYSENAPCPYSMRLKSGCRIGLFNPWNVAPGEMIPLITDTMRPRYIADPFDGRWIELPDGWDARGGRLTRGPDGRATAEEPNGASN